MSDGQQDEDMRGRFLTINLGHVLIFIGMLAAAWASTIAVTRVFDALQGTVALLQQAVGGHENKLQAIDGELKDARSKRETWEHKTASDISDIKSGMARIEGATGVRHGSLGDTYPVKP